VFGEAKGISQQESRDRSLYASKVLPMATFPLLNDLPGAATGPAGK